MKYAPVRFVLLSLLALAVASSQAPVLAQSAAVAADQAVAVERSQDSAADVAGKKALDHDAYDIWKGIGGEMLSRNGLWVLYELTLQDGDPELRVRSLTGDTEYMVPRGTGARFDAGSRFVVARVAPAVEAARQAKREKAEPDEQPKAGLAIIDLASGEVTEIERVKSFALGEDGGGWVAILLEKETEPAADEPAADPEMEQEAEPGEETAQEPAAEEDAEAEKKEKKTGTTLVLRSLTDGAETRFESVVAYRLAKSGQRLAFATATEDGDGDGAFVVDLDDGAPVATPALTGEGNYGSFAFDDSGTRLAFLTDRDDYESDPAERMLYLWEGGVGAASSSGEARLIAASGTPGIADGWQVSEHRDPLFS